MSVIREFSVRELLSQDRYVIPIYQRNYAWEAKEIEQLIQDVVDYWGNCRNLSYYIGTLVVSAIENENNPLYYTIDGQQRLTTLSVLLAVIRNEFKPSGLDWFAGLNLSFESRRKSTDTLKAAFLGKFDQDNYEANIQLAYQICQRDIERRTHDLEFDLVGFADYLCNHVKLLRIPLPTKTNLNHYFEIMNSRGEQLEKHEILKAILLKTFAGQKKEKLYSHCFNLIWQGAANMERYIQYGFTVDQRHLLFGKSHWNTLTVESFDDVVEKIGSQDTKKEDSNKLSIDQILALPDIDVKIGDDDDPPSRFNTVIDFPNFLLHILRIQEGSDKVALDDKRLILLFMEQMRNTKNGEIAFAKAFIFNLLKFKFLFDKYIIKREFVGNSSRWSLQSLKWYGTGKKQNVQFFNTFNSGSTGSVDGDNRKILMLLSMFHVSIPSLSYKYWLNATLNYLSNNFEVDSSNYIAYLEHIAKSFVFDRFLSSKQLEYFPMINENLHPVKRDREALDLEKLRYERIENNLVFNFCDYLLWNKYKNQEKDPRVSRFEYTFRSSREHYYPQTPIKKDLPILESEYLHSFGNLCLISHEKNSRLNNHSPVAKKDFFSKSETIDSLKQFFMMKYNLWDEWAIKQHEKQMIDLLIENLDSEYSSNYEQLLGQQWFNEYQTRDRNLLIRALYCFGEISRHLSGSTYDLFDFEYIREQEAFIKFRKYVDENHPASLTEVIDQHLANDVLKSDYRYLFIRYPEVIGYCQNGRFQWKENDTDPIIYLLENDNYSKNQAKELYAWLLQLHLEQAYCLKFYSDNQGLCININYENGIYLLTADRKSDFQLQIWNAGGSEIQHVLISELNGNHKAVKLLPEYKWEKTESNTFERFGKARLLILDASYYQGLLDLIEETVKLLKNGFGIKPLQK